MLRSADTLDCYLAHFQIDAGASHREEPLRSHLLDCRSCRRRLLARLRSTDPSDPALRPTLTFLARLQNLPPRDRAAACPPPPKELDPELLLELLLDECRAALPGDPNASRAWAETAEAFLRRARTPSPGTLPRALAYKANAARAAGDLQEARQGLTRAWA
ncbi:MAG: hypothetical protein ACOC92_02130, partial [bacterium]